jgi:hypothetical protein
MAKKDARKKPFKYHSYGIIPMPNYPTPDTKPIQWLGYKGSKTPGKPTIWLRLSFDFDVLPLLSYPDIIQDQILAFPKPLYVVSARTSNPPLSIQEWTKHQVHELGEMYVRYSWDGWTVKQCQQLARDGVEGVMLPNGTTTATYRVRFRFGKSMIYVELRNQKKMRHRYTQVYVLPYGGGTPGQIMNLNYLGSPPYGKVNCGSWADLGLPLNATNRQVGEAIALVLMREFGLPLDQARSKAM